MHSSRVADGSLLQCVLARAKREAAERLGSALTRAPPKPRPGVRNLIEICSFTLGYAV